MEQKCYKYLLENFGLINCKGVKYLAMLVDLYQYGDNIEDLYSVVAERVSSTPAAVKRAVYYYTKEWYNKATAQELAVLLNYTLRPNQVKLTTVEIVPLLKMYLEEQE